MSSERADAPTPPASRLLGRSPLPPRRPGSPTLYAYLLDFDDELADELEARMRFSARQHATARLFDADAGECDLSAWFRAAGAGPGLMIVEGLLTVETRVAGRAVTELLGKTDLLQPPTANEDDMIGGCSAWRTLCPSRLALLDSDFLERVRSWPEITGALFRRAERRTSDLGVLRAISCQPKLEVRLVLLLWHLAARWGRVEPTGIRVSLPLTHRLLGQLVAAERPSISHAMGRLAQAGIVTGTAGDWHLHGSVDDHLESLTERTAHLGPGRGEDRRLDAGARAVGGHGKPSEQRIAQA